MNALKTRQTLDLQSKQVESSAQMVASAAHDLLTPLTGLHLIGMVFGILASSVIILLGLETMMHFFSTRNNCVEKTHITVRRNETTTNSLVVKVEQ
jgi:hypothetical protein